MDHKIAVHMVDKINLLFKEKRKYKETYGKEPSLDELAKLLNTNKDKIIELENIIKETEPTFEKIKLFCVDDLSKQEYEELIQKANENKYLLNEKEQEILLLSLGLKDGRKWSLEELSSKYNITEERVRQILAKSIRILKHPEKRKKLKDYLN